jgi:hypothetical protein
MMSIPGLSILTVAVLQGAVALLALSASPAAAAAAAAIGVLALGRYGAVSLFASSVCERRGGAWRLVAASAWALGLLALGAAVAAVAVKAPAALPWAAAAAFAGPVGMSVLALGSGLGALAAGGRR